MDLLVILDHPLFVLRRANEPAPARILDQRILIRTPTEGILMQILFEMIKEASSAQLAGDVLIALFDPAPLIVWSFGGELAVRTDRADQLGPFTRHESRLFGDEQI